MAGGYLPWLGGTYLGRGHLPWPGEVHTLGYPHPDLPRGGTYLGRGRVLTLRYPHLDLAGGYVPWTGGTYLGWGGSYLGWGVPTYFEVPPVLTDRHL